MSLTQGLVFRVRRQIFLTKAVVSILMLTVRTSGVNDRAVSERSWACM